MAKKGGAGGDGGNSKKAQGQARKAEAAANKAAVEHAKAAAVEDADWERGAKKGNAKKENAEAKKAEAARKKAERDAALAEEEKSTPGRSAPKNAKTAVKKTKGIDAAFGQLDGGSGGGSLAALNASGIEDAIDALGLTESGTNVADIDKHPERRKAKAYKVWRQNNVEREKELQREGFAYKRREDKLYAEFLASPDNPMNQVAAKYNTTRAEMAAIQAEEKRKVEERLGSK